MQAELVYRSLNGLQAIYLAGLLQRGSQEPMQYDAKKRSASAARGDRVGPNWCWGITWRRSLIIQENACFTFWFKAFYTEHAAA